MDKVPQQATCPHDHTMLNQIVRDGNPAIQEYDGIVYALMICPSCRSSFTIPTSSVVKSGDTTDMATAPPYK